MSPLYRLASYLVLGTAWPFLLFHPKVKGNWRQRLGLYPKNVDAMAGRGPGTLWFHGASAGDLVALYPVIREVKAKRPDATIVVSTMTNTGLQVAKDKLAALSAWITVVPWDFPGATRRAVAAIRPDVLVLEYAELWPNLLCAAREMGARIVVTNGRVSERLVPRYRALYRIAGNPLGWVDRFLMREGVEAERVIALGAPRDRVKVTGNTKFDNVQEIDRPLEETHPIITTFAETNAPVWVAGSTHEGEEASLFAVFSRIKHSFPRLRMIVAPRYPERGARVAALAAQAGLEAERASDPNAARPARDVLILDTMGDLMSAYACATVVFVGGSFVARGGQNILEPAGLGRPVLFGPNMANFRDAVEVLLGRGGIQVRDAQHLEEVLVGLLGQPDTACRLGAMAKEAVRQIQGASKANADHIVSLLDEPRGVASRETLTSPS